MRFVVFHRVSLPTLADDVGWGSGAGERVAEASSPQSDLVSAVARAPPATGRWLCADRP